MDVGIVRDRRTNPEPNCRAHAVWPQYRALAGSCGGGCSLLDLVMGTNWTSAFDTPDGVPGVLGRHVERLEFLDVILGDQPALTPEQNFFQRMLAGDPDEA